MHKPLPTVLFRSEWSTLATKSHDEKEAHPVTTHTLPLVKEGQVTVKLESYSLPAPFGPSKPNRWPRGMPRHRSCTATWSHTLIRSNIWHGMVDMIPGTLCQTVGRRIELVVNQRLLG